MSLVSEFKNPGAVLQFLDTADGKYLVEYFKTVMESSIRQTRRGKELKDIFYAQGAADVAENIVDLKKDILKYQDDLRTGKIKKEIPKG